MLFCFLQPIYFQLNHSTFVFVRAKVHSKNYLQAVAEKNAERDEKLELQKQLQVAQRKITHFRAKNDSVQELKRHINELRSNRDVSERADNR